ncbi:hypothetical protein CLOP_g3618, partial [Closterium sp. NIES-67]
LCSSRSHNTSSSIRFTSWVVPLLSNSNNNNNNNSHNSFSNSSNSNNNSSNSNSHNNRVLFFNRQIFLTAPRRWDDLEG